MAEQEIGRQLLNEMASFSETSICRRKMILHYFGEHFEEERCNKMCDNCRHPKERMEGREYLSKVLDLVKKLKQTQKAKHYCSVLTGKQTAEVKAYKHDAIPEYGSGNDKDEHFWNAVIRQATVGGYLSKDIESYGVLKLTDKGEAYLTNPIVFELIKEHDYLVIEDESVVTSTGGRNTVIDQELYDKLLDLRKSISSQKNIPPFVIFQEPSLRDMCFQYPISIEELTNIQGVGTGKAARYGSPFVRLIKEYVEENNIERPQDVVVKSVVNKSGLKVHLIQNIDRKLPLEDIGRAQGKNVEEVIDEIESIVQSGTKVNINYYIDDVIDEDVQEEIYEYFSEAETDDLTVAYEEFDGDYSEEELRLIRIKFMSEMAN